MPFGLKQKLNETEKFQKKLDKSLKRTAHKQMVLDTLQTKRALKEENKKLKLYKQIKPQAQTQGAPKEEQNIISDTAETINEQTSTKQGEVNQNKINDFFAKALINMEYFFSNLSQKMSRNRKIITLTLCVLAITAISISAYNYFVCYEINLDGNDIGIVASHNKLNSALDKLQSDLQNEYELPSLYFERSVTSKKVIVFDRENILSADEIYEKAKKANLPLFCIGGVININGVDTVKLSSKAKAQEALDTFYDYFKESPADWVKVLNIPDIKTDENIKIAEKVISIGSDCTVDEAVDYLLGLSANAITSNDNDGRVVIASLPQQSALQTAQTTITSASANEKSDEIRDFDENETMISQMSYTIPQTALAFRADLSSKEEVDTSLNLNVRMTSQVEYYRDIPYETVEYENSSLYKGERIVTTSGVNGKSYVKANIVSENGILVSEEILHEEVYEEAVNEAIAVGTRPLPVLNGESPYIMPTTGLVSSTNREGSHSGFRAVDIANREGTGIYAARAGYVIFATQDNSGYGKYIKVDHGDGYVTWYAHLSEFKVSVGDYVNQGELIGLMGNTGRSTGPHLHLEVRYNNARMYIPAFFNIEYGDYVYAFE